MGTRIVNVCVRTDYTVGGGVGATTTIYRQTGVLAHTGLSFFSLSPCLSLVESKKGTARDRIVENERRHRRPVLDLVQVRHINLIFFF